MIRVLIADDSPVIQEGLTLLLRAYSQLEIIGVASDGQEAVDKARELLPDLIIMDAEMPNVDGVEATRIIKQATPTVGVLVFSIFADCLEASFNAGANAFLTKDCDLDELVAKLEEIAAESKGLAI